MTITTICPILLCKCLKLLRKYKKTIGITLLVPSNEHNQIWQNVVVLETTLVVGYLEQYSNVDGMFNKRSFLTVKVINGISLRILFQLNLPYCNKIFFLNILQLATINYYQIIIFIVYHLNKKYSCVKWSVNVITALKLNLKVS